MIETSKYFLKDIKLGDSTISVITDEPGSFEKRIINLAKQCFCTRVGNPVAYYKGKKKKITEYKILFKSKVDKERFIEELNATVNA